MGFALWPDEGFGNPCCLECGSCICCLNCRNPDSWTFKLPDNAFSAGRCCDDATCAGFNGVEIVLTRAFGPIYYCFDPSILCFTEIGCEYLYNVTCGKHCGEPDDGCSLPAGSLSAIFDVPCGIGNTALIVNFGCCPNTGCAPDSACPTIYWNADGPVNCCDPVCAYLGGGSLCAGGFDSCTFGPGPCGLGPICIRPVLSCLCHGCTDSPRPRHAIITWDTSGLIVGTEADVICSNSAADCPPPPAIICDFIDGDNCGWSYHSGDIHATVEFRNTLDGTWEGTPTEPFCNDCADHVREDGKCAADEANNGECVIRAHVWSEAHDPQAYGCLDAWYYGNGLTCTGATLTLDRDTDADRPMIGSSQACCDPGNPDDAGLGCTGLPGVLILTFD